MSSLYKKAKQLPNLPNISVMLKRMGYQSLDDLFADIPASLKIRGPLDLPGGSSEIEVEQHTSKVMKENKQLKIFAGDGFFLHYIPALIEEISARAEFFTSYTPYTPEANQGLLQAIFEYQSLICELTEMDVANASLYDWNSALGEAARMSFRVNRRREIVIPEITPPERVKTLKLYVEPLKMRVKQVKYDRRNGQLDMEDLKVKVNKDTSLVYFEFPYNTGIVETEVDAISEIAHDNGALLAVGVNPFSLAIFKAPGEYGADMVIGEGQSLGNPLQFGGASLGIFACRGDRKLIYQMPGRIVGITTPLNGKDRVYTLALPAREQHIRRERATSNICTNQALYAIRAGVYLSLLGKHGMKRIAESILANTYYAIGRIEATDSFAIPFSDKSVYFSEFAVKALQGDAIDIWRRLIRRNILAGRPSRYKGDFWNALILAVTEVHTKRDIDCLAYELASLAGDKNV